MFRMNAKGDPATVRLALACALGSGMALACLASLLGLPGGARAEDRTIPRIAQADHSSDHTMQSGTSALSTRSTTTPTPLDVDRAGPSTMLGLGDFERMAMERNPTLRQALAQFDAARSRSFQAGL